jgi:hypothetical protein
MLNLSDRSVSDIISSSMSGVWYIATSGDKLYYTNYNTHAVTCCDFNQAHVDYSDHPWKTIVVYNVVHQGR